MTDTLSTSDNIAALAAAFAALLQRDLTPDQWAEMRRKNGTPDYAETGACASHDYCDANMVMDEAFTLVVGRELDMESGADVTLWNEAWGRASDLYLTDPEHAARLAFARRMDAQDCAARFDASPMGDL